MSENVKGGCLRQVDGTAGLPQAPEMQVCPASYAWCQEETLGKIMQAAVAMMSGYSIGMSGALTWRPRTLPI
jgi:hypothetical protein